MGERASLRVVLFTNYSSASRELLDTLLAQGIVPTLVVFAPAKVQRLSWGVRIKNFLRSGSFREPKTILNREGIPFSFVESHNSPEAKELLRSSHTDILLLYGTKIIQEEVLHIPSIGVLNAHSALLPKYRGTKVEFWILYNKEPQYAGVTIHWVNPGLDEGDIFLQEPLSVSSDDTPDTLRAKSIPLAGKLFAEAIRRIYVGDIIRLPQDAAQATKVQRPTPEQVIEFNSRKRNAR